MLRLTSSCFLGMLSNFAGLIEVTGASMHQWACVKDQDCIIHVTGVVSGEDKAILTPLDHECGSWASEEVGLPQHYNQASRCLNIYRRIFSCRDITFETKGI